MIPVGADGLFIYVAGNIGLPTLINVRVLVGAANGERWILVIPALGILRHMLVIAGLPYWTLLLSLPFAADLAALLALTLPTTSQEWFFACGEARERFRQERQVEP